MIYWKIYNTLLFNFQDKMVACYPPIPNEEGRTYERSVLNILL